MNDIVESPQIPLKFINRRPKIIHSHSELDNFIKQTIMEWAETEFTCPYAIYTYIQQIIEPHAMKVQFSQMYNNIHSMKKHTDIIQNINSHIWALISIRPAVTYYDVYKLVNILCDGNHRIVTGPLTKMPIVKSYLFGNAEVKNYDLNISLSDIIVDCANFLSEKLSSCKEQDKECVVNSLTERQFLHYLLDKYHRYDFKLLGVKIVNFKALRDAAYVTNIESFHQVVNSKKVTKLMRSDVKKALKNVQEKLKITTENFFHPNDVPWKRIDRFANMEFSDAVKIFFQPFIDEEIKVLGKLNGQLKNKDQKEYPLEFVKKMINFLTTEKMYGRLFQLAAIAGSVNQCQSSLMFLEDGFSINKLEPWGVLSKLKIEDWKSNLFCPLLKEIGLFLYFLLSESTSSAIDDKLLNMLGPIFERCRAVAHVVPRFCDSESKSSIQEYKLQCLLSLSKCAQTISDYRSQQDWFTNKQQLAILHLDLLPQALNLLIRILSKSQIDPLQSSPSLTSSNQSHCFSGLKTEVIECVFKGTLQEFIKSKSIKELPFSFQDLSELELQILRTLGIESWPLDGSFMDFFSKHMSTVKVIIELNNQEIKDNSEQPMEQDNHGQCQCIGLSSEYISHCVRQMSPTVSLDSLLNTILPSQLYGVNVTESSRRSFIDIWNNVELRQHHLLDDGLPPAMDMRATYLINSSNRSSQNLKDILAVSSPEVAMQAVSSVPLLTNATAATKWNQIYSIYWGNITHFINSHPVLASQLNVRVIVSEIGVLRINVRPDTVPQFVSTLQSISQSSGSEYFSKLRVIIGNIVSVLINLSCPDMALKFSRYIDSLASHFLASENSFHQFCNSCIDLVPPELLVDFFTSLVFPLTKRVFIQNETDNLVQITKFLKSLFNEIDSTVVTVLRLNLPFDHPLMTIVSQQEKIFESKIDSPALTTDNNSFTAEIESNPISTEPFIKVHGTVEDMDSDSNLIIDIDPVIETTDKRLVVEDIRKGDFGIGMDLCLDSTNRRIVESFNNKMARLVDHLSNDLYANASHFVLELVQNADDNRYNSSSQGCLELTWKTPQQQDGGGALVLEVKNNELGFSESDLRSLCDIGASTKRADRAGKIGRKGIGFKSVFLVSNSPEIHSNGYHVRFERYKIDNENQLVSKNALIPTWCDSVNKGSSYGTTIILPIIPSLASDVRKSVSDKLDPSLLLFLRKLTKISISSENGLEKLIELVPDECNFNRKVVVTETGEKHNWSVCSQLIPIVDIELQKISPCGLSRTEISIAIPLEDSTESSRNLDLPAFAFLPIRSYGLRFIINADFSIPASREDVLHDCPWNQWLIEQSAHLFSQHLLTVANTESSTDGQIDLLRVIECIPLPGEVPGDTIFHSMIPRLRTLLSEISWLPDRYGTLHAPTKLIVEFINDDRLTRALGDRLHVTLLHPAIAGCVRERVTRVLSWLGCQPLSLDLLSRLVTALTPTDLSDHELIRGIILAVHSCLERESSFSTTANRVMIQLATLPIWPVVSSCKEEYVPVNQSSGVPVFLLPLTSSRSDETLTSLDQFSSLRRIISPRFLASFQIEKKQPQSNQSVFINAARSVLQRIGIPELSNTAVIECSILTRLKSQPPSHPSRQWLISCAAFLATQCTPNEYRERVLPFLFFATISIDSTGSSKSTISNFEEVQRAHLPQGNDLKSGICEILHSKIDYVHLDKAHLSFPSVSASQWRDFFLQIGATDCFYRTTNGELPELRALLQLKNRQVNTDLLRYLDSRWNNISCNSTIVAECQQECIPVCKTQEELVQPDVTGLEQASPMRNPRDCVFIWSGAPNKISTLAPDSLLQYFPVCRVMFSSETLPLALGMRTSVGTELVSRFLRAWFVEKTVCGVTARQARDLFSWIKHHLSHASIKTVFSGLRSALGGSMLVPVSGSISDNNEPCELLLDQFCYWTLPISGACTQPIYIQDQQVLEDLQGALRSTEGPTRALIRQYPELHDLFVDIIGVREYPTLEEIWPALRSSLQCLSPDRLRDLNSAELDLICDVFNVSKFLLGSPDGVTAPSLLELPMIPCLSGEYRALRQPGNQFIIYSWRSIDTVHEFQQRLAESNDHAKIDFVSINCHVSQGGRRSWANQSRLSAAQFLNQHFNLPVLEDELCFSVDDRDSYKPSADVRAMLSHAEVIVTQWFERHANRDGLARCLNLLGSITECAGRPDNEEPAPVSVTVSLQGRPDISYRTQHSVYIGPVYGSYDSHELLVGGGSSNPLQDLLSALASWILRGDRFSHLRERFSKFSRSLLDLVESSDSNQISIFVRSHNLRINPFTIDYISSTLDIDRVSPEPQQNSQAQVISRKNKRKLEPSCIETVPEKQPRSSDLDSGSSVESSASINLGPQEPIDQPKQSIVSVKKSPSTINRSDLRLRISSAMTMDEAAQTSGRIGEQLVNQRLTDNRLLGDWDIVRLDWLNRDKESLLPYDFRLSARRRRPEPEMDNDNGIDPTELSPIEVIYLEVKATTQSNKVQFDLSPQEATAAWSFKHQYHLLLVFHSGRYPDHAARFVHIPDTLGQLQDNRCKLLMDVSKCLLESQ